MQDGGQDWRQNNLFSNTLGLCNHIRRDRHQIYIVLSLLVRRNWIILIYLHCFNFKLIVLLKRMVRQQQTMVQLPFCVALFL